MHNFIAYFRKGGDFLKPFWAKWPRKQVAFFHGRTVKEAESNIFTCKPCSIFKTLGLIRLSRILSTTKTAIPKLSHANCVTIQLTIRAGSHDLGKQCPWTVCYLLSCFSLDWLPWPPGKGDYSENFHPDAGITILGSQLTGLARLSYNRKVDFCSVYLRCRVFCKVGQPGACNQALSSIAKFYAFPLTSPNFKAPEHTLKTSALPLQHLLFDIKWTFGLIHVLSIQTLPRISEKQS